MRESRELTRFFAAPPPEKPRKPGFFENFSSTGHRVVDNHLQQSDHQAAFLKAQEAAATRLDESLVKAMSWRF